MASRFVDLNEAAQMLGMTPEQLIEKRSNGDIYGYRDGGSWKFKTDEIERYQAEMRDGGGSSLGLGMPPGGDDAETILVSNQLVEPTPEMASSTIIGQSGGAPQADSDLRLISESDGSLKAEFGSELSLEEIGSEISLDAGPAKKGSAVDSDVSLIPGVGTDSDVKLVADTGSDKALHAPPAAKADVLGDSELKLASGAGSGLGPAASGSAASRIMGSGSKLGSGDLDIALDSELALSDDDDMVIGGSDVGSDLALSAADSGISLGSPTDSGLSLEADSGISLQSPTDSGLSLEEAPLDMGGSSISSLELPEDESVSLSSGSLAAEPAPNLKKDEDFLLTPSDEMFTDESDSGSQVIALEDSVAFEQEPGALVSEDVASAGLEEQLDALAAAGLASPMASAGLTGGGGPPEAPYSVAHLSFLAITLLVMILSGVLMADMVRNMWAWDDGMDVASSISEGISGAFGFK